MNVAIDRSGGHLSVEKPKNKASDYVIYEAEMDLTMITLTASLTLQSNGGSDKFDKFPS